MRRTLAALTLPLLLAADTSPGRGATSTPEQVVRKHLDWLSKTDNYRARVTSTDGATTVAGLLLHDTQTRESIVLMRPDGTLPERDPAGKPVETIYVKLSRRQPNTGLLAYSLGFSRPDDLPFAERTVPYNPFGSGAPDLFVRGQGVQATMGRVNQIASSVTSLGSSDLGAMGLEMRLRTSMLDGLMKGVNRALGDQSPSSAPPSRVTAWFNADGRLSAVVLGRDESAPNVTVTLEYETTNLPATVWQELLSRATVLPPPPSLATPDQTAVAARVIAPLLDGWTLTLFSTVLAGLSVGFVVRLAHRAGQP